MNSQGTNQPNGDAATGSPTAQARQAVADSVEATKKSNGPSEPVDVDQLMHRCLGNIEFAQKVLDKFESGFGDGLEELEKLLNERNVNEMARIAHRLKGAAANAAAPTLQQIVAQVEELGRGGNVSELNECLWQLKTEWSRFKEFSSESGILQRLQV